MADNVETLGNFSNPIVPKPISKMTPMESLGEIEKAGQAQQASYKNLGEQTAQFDIQKAKRLSEEATRQSDLGMAEIGKTRQALAEVETPTFKPTQETFISMSSVAGLIAFVGSAMGQQGKRSGKSAIDSMTGMMNGYQTGRQDLFRREQIKFDKELQTMKSLNDKLLKDLTLAQDVMKYDFAKGQADAAVAIAGFAGPVTKAKFENEGNEKALNFTAKLSEGLININKISADIGLKYATLAQTKEIAMMKAGGAAGKPLKDKEINSITGLESLASGLTKLKDTFKPGYASLGIFGVGADLEAEAMRRFGNEEGRKAVAWWSSYQRLQAPNRHALFGATLTGNELKNYQEFTAKKSDQFLVVKDFLQDQIDYTLGTAGQRRRAFESAGYRLPDAEPVDFTTTYGNAPISTGGGNKPVPTDADRQRANSSPESRQRFINHFGVEP